MREFKDCQGAAQLGECLLFSIRPRLLLIAGTFSSFRFIFKILSILFDISKVFVNKDIKVFLVDLAMK
jgi:hypothetical protein